MDRAQLGADFADDVDYLDQMVGVVRVVLANGMPRESVYAKLLTSIDGAGGVRMSAEQTRRYAIRSLAAALVLLAEAGRGAAARVADAAP